MATAHRAGPAPRAAGQLARRQRVVVNTWTAP